jgi:ribosomal protein S25
LDLNISSQKNANDNGQNSTILFKEQPTMPINAVQVNANGGIYSHGKGHSFEKKLEVYLMLQKLKKQKLEEGDLRPVTHRALASASKVSTKFACKVMAEANAGALIDPAEEKKWKKKTTNPGAKTITGLDEVVLLQLRYRL